MHGLITQYPLIYAVIYRMRFSLKKNGSFLVNLRFGLTLNSIIIIIIIILFSWPCITPKVLSQVNHSRNNKKREFRLFR